MSDTGAETKSGNSVSDTRTDTWTNAFPAIAISVAGILVAFAVIWWLLLANAQQAAEEARIQQSLNEANGILSARLNEFETQVRSIATSEWARTQSLPALGVDPGSNTALPWESLLPFYRRISVFPRGSAEVDLQAAIPINFAALDLIKRAESEPFSGPEVSLNHRDLVYAAAPVTVDGKIAGTKFVAIETRWFALPFSQIAEPEGSFEVVQSFQATEPTTVMQWGSGGDGSSAEEAATTNANWTLRFLPRAAPVDVPGFTSLLPTLALCLAFVLGGIFLGFSRLARKLAVDLGTLQGALTRFIKDGSLPTQRYSMSAIRNLSSQLMSDDTLRNSRASQLPTTASPFAGQSTAHKAPIDGRPARATSPTKVGARINELLAENRDEASEEDFLKVAGKSDPKLPTSRMQVEENPGAADFGIKLDPTIFRAYDIRGLSASNLSADVVYWLGRSFAGEAIAENHHRVVVAQDGRLSSGELREALVNGLTEGGMEVTDIGLVPTPVLYYATHELGTGTGVMITGSHNPPEFNGLKLVLGGMTLAEDRILRLKDRIERNDLPRGEGSVQSLALLDRYIARIVGDVAIADALKVVVDCGNGVAGLVAPRLLEEMGCEVVPLYCEVDGNFPNHHPDPAEPTNLEDLITVVQAEGADLGIAFDGDGDRLGLVTNRGEIIWPDKLMMLFSQDIVGRNPGADIIYDVKCSRHLSALISEYGGRPIMWKTGHSHIKAKLHETGALLAGEFSGHICFGERWYGFDDAIYAAARLLEIVSAEGRSVADLFAQFPVTYSTPELKVRTTDSAKFVIMDKLRAKANFGDGTVTTIDGLRVDFADGWGLVRPSNTGPVLSLRFEADGQAALQRIRSLFQAQLSAIDPALKIR